MAGKTVRLSQLYGMRTVSTAGRTGYIIRVIADGGRITGFVCADGNEREFFADAASATVTDGCIIAAETDSAAGNSIRLGIPLIDCAGNAAGRVDDITIRKDAMLCVYCGRKKYPADGIAFGDFAVLPNAYRTLKSDVKKDGRVILKRGTALSESSFGKAKREGEYIQTALKSI